MFSVMDIDPINSLKVIFRWIRKDNFCSQFGLEMHLCTYQFKAGGGGGRAWGGDLTFFKNLPSNSLPTGKLFQSNAQKFPHPGRCIARTLIVRIGKKIDFVSLYPRLLQYRNI